MVRNKELTYKRWKGMKSRCYAPSFNNEQNKYQSLGIIVCERWRKNYLNFKSDMGECPEGYSLERINPLGNYEPSNCKWIPISEQSKNRTSCLLYTLGDESKILKDWAREFNIKYTTLYHRVVRSGMTLQEALKYSKLVNYKGKTQSVKAWCKELGISQVAAHSKKYATDLSYPEIFDFYTK